MQLVPSYRSSTGLWRADADWYLRSLPLLFRSRASYKVRDSRLFGVLRRPAVVDEDGDEDVNRDPCREDDTGETKCPPVGQHLSARD